LAAAEFCAGDHRREFSETKFSELTGPDARSFITAGEWRPALALLVEAAKVIAYDGRPAAIVSRPS
jgi:hypothetical protein